MGRRRTGSTYDTGGRKGPSAGRYARAQAKKSGRPTKVKTRRPNDTDELDRFNTLDLPPLAVHFGYTYNDRDSFGEEHHFSKRISERDSVTQHARPIMYMRDYDGGKRWRWFDPLMQLRTKPQLEDGCDQPHAFGGSVVDFVIANLVRVGEPASVGEARKFLRGWSGSEAEKAAAVGWDDPIRKARSAPAREQKTPDDVEHLLLREHVSTLGTVWLSQRGVRSVSEQRFGGTIYRPTGDRAASVFPHWISGRITSFERRAHGQSPMSLKGGTKGIWYSMPLPGDERVVAVESPLDALSHDVLHGDGKTRYVATFGTMSEIAKDDLSGILADWGLPVFTGYDNDTAGDNAAALMRQEIMFDKRMTQRLRPETLDWNDDLRLKLGLLRPTAIAKVRDKAGVDLDDPEILRGKLQAVGCKPDELAERLEAAREVRETSF